MDEFHEDDEIMATNWRAWAFCTGLLAAYCGAWVWALS